MKAGATDEPKSESKPDANTEPTPDAKAESKPEAIPESKPEVKAKTPSDLTPQITKRAYELYEQRSRQGDSGVQDWERAEQEIRKDAIKAKPEPKPEVQVESKPESKVEPKPEAKVEVKPDAKAQPPSDLTPQLVKRVHKLYEELGREDVRAVEDLEKTNREIRKDDK